MEERKLNRYSSFELVKIFAMILIVFSHTYQTLSILDVSSTCSYLTKCLIGQTGELGNMLFFCCSAWFLIGRKTETEKTFNIIATAWFISVLFLIVYLCLHNIDISKIDIIKQLLPTIFENNWYITCYVIFMFVYPIINIVIESINKALHLKIVLFSSLLWIIGNYIENNLFFPSVLLTWISIYFLIAYIKLYCNRNINKKNGTILLVFGILGYFGQVYVTQYLNRLFNFGFSPAYWNSDYCPFYLMIAIGSIFIANAYRFKSKSINYLSSLSMKIYLIHENYLFRNYRRSILFDFALEYFGITNMLIATIFLAAIMYIISVLLSVLYTMTLQKLINKFSHVLYVKQKNILNAIINEL